jgi:antitoxin (DNA-binding transcriptional repressor) of toxin-antitoxin stability system
MYAQTFDIGYVSYSNRSVARLVPVARQACRGAPENQRGLQRRRSHLRQRAGCNRRLQFGAHERLRSQSYAA